MSKTTTPKTKANGKTTKTNGVDAPAMPTFDDRRKSMQTRFGQLVLATLRLKRYQGLGVADLDQLLLAPLLADRVAFAETDTASATPVGMAIWASVSDEVSNRIAEQVDLGVFPVRLAKDEWRSGEHAWLLDVLVPNRKAGTAVFMNFSKLLENRSFRMHPVVMRSIDEAIVEKLKAAVASAAPKLDS